LKRVRRGPAKQAELIGRFERREVPRSETRPLTKAERARFDRIIKRGRDRVSREVWGMTKHDNGATTDARATVSVKLSKVDDRLLEKFCERTGQKKGELVGKLVRWYIDLPEEAQSVALQRPTALSARYFAAMLRELADAIEKRGGASRGAEPEKEH
jgi:hypothetical protein